MFITIFLIYYVLQSLDIDVFQGWGMSRYYCVTCSYVTCIYDILCNSEFPDVLVLRFGLRN